MQPNLCDTCNTRAEYELPDQPEGLTVLSCACRRVRVVSGLEDVQSAPYRKALAGARQADPKSTFVASCQAFFDSNGFLTPKQVAGLERKAAEGRKGFTR